MTTKINQELENKIDQLLIDFDESDFYLIKSLASRFYLMAIESSYNKDSLEVEKNESNKLVNAAYRIVENYSWNDLIKNSNNFLKSLDSQQNADIYMNLFSLSCLQDHYFNSVIRARAYEDEED